MVSRIIIVHIMESTWRPSDVGNPLKVVPFSCSIVSDSLQLHGLQHARLPCPSPTPWACSNSCPLSQWWLPAISCSVIPCHPLFLLPSILPSIQVFSNESALHIRWPKYWSFNISPSNEYWGLISFRIDWLDLLEVNHTLKSLLQHHSSKTSILWYLAFFKVHFSHPCITTGKPELWLDRPLSVM